MDYDSVVKLLIALLLVLLNGFFVAAEFSIVKVRYSQIQIKAAEGNKMAKQAEHIIKHVPERFLLPNLMLMKLR
jgi:CBS domain containing-hemolysin-like protein